METVAKEVGKPRDDDCAQAEIHLQSRLIPGCLLLRFSELARLCSMELAGCDRVVEETGVGGRFAMTGTRQCSNSLPAHAQAALRRDSRSLVWLSGLQ